MHFLYTILIALANNIDNIGVRIAYSIRGIKISALTNLWISVITFIISTFAAFAGNEMAGFLNKQVTSIISMILLTAIGVWTILEQYLKKDIDNEKPDKKDKYGVFDVLKKPEKADRDSSKSIDIKEATILGIALSINNIGGGISAGMIGLNIFFIGLMSAVISFIILWAGNYITKFINRYKLGNKATIAAGIALILIGLKQIM